MIVDWLETFMLALRESYPPPPAGPHAWPEYGTDEWSVYFGDWQRHFARQAVSEREAEEARSLMGEDPPRFRAEYIQKTMAAVKILREMNPACDPAAKDDRASAADASRGCGHCHGLGLAIVYAVGGPDPDRNVPADVSAYCVCALGRWIEGNHREKQADVHRRTPDLKAVIAGRSTWRLDPPGYDFSADRNRPAVGVAALIRQWTSSLGRDERPSPPPRPRPDLGRVEPAVPIPKWEATVEPEPPAVEGAEQGAAAKTQ